MAGTLRNPLKGANEFLVTSSLNWKRLQVTPGYCECVSQTSDSGRVCRVALSLRSCSIAP